MRAPFPAFVGFSPIHVRQCGAKPPTRSRFSPTEEAACAAAALLDRLMHQGPTDAGGSGTTGTAVARMGFEPMTSSLMRLFGGRGRQILAASRLSRESEGSAPDR